MTERTSPECSERVLSEATLPATLSEADAALFREAVGAVKPLQSERAHARPARRPQPVPSRRLRIAEQIRSLDSPFDPEMEGGDILAYARPGVSPRTLRKLRRGQLAVEAQLDLHGMSSAGAHGALADFLAHAQRRRLRCVRVIHGKGYGSASGRPVIKAKVNRWLRLHPDVVAYCSAPRAAGGTGAMHLLLKA